VSFGSNLHTVQQQGRYEFALFRNTPPYLPTTSPSGEADSQYRADARSKSADVVAGRTTVGTRVVNGDSVTIIIGKPELVLATTPPTGGSSSSRLTFRVR